MKTTIILSLIGLFFIPAKIVAQEELKNEPIVTTQNDALFLRRIVEFYQEGEKEIVIKEIDGFLDQYPKSSLSDSLCLLAGDLYIKENEFAKAIDYFNKIEKDKDKQRSFYNQLQCLYHLGKYEKILDNARTYLKNNLAIDQKDRINITYLLSLAYHEKIKESLEDQKLVEKLAADAIGYYQTLIDTEYSSAIKECLAYSYNILKKYKDGANLYLELAKLDSINREKYLLQAAKLQSKYDPEVAITTYGQVCYLDGDKASTAAFNRLVLLFDNGKYSDIILLKDQLFSLIPEDKKSLFYFFLGRSHFAVEDYKRAKLQFNEFLALQTEENIQLKLALSALINCCQKTGDLQLLDDVIAQVEKFYPHTQVLSKAFLTKALMHKKENNIASAKDSFEKIRKLELPVEKEENFFFEYAHLLFLAQDWKESRAQFKAYLDKYSEDVMASLAWHYLIHSSTKQAELEDKGATEAKILLCLDLEARLLDQKNLSKLEKAEYVYLLGKTKYVLNDHEDAIEILSNFITEFQESRFLPEAHLYLGFSYREFSQDLVKFSEHAEEALLLNPEIENHENVHLCLFNAYRKLQENDPKLMKKMAEHLYCYQSYEGTEISYENQFWLSGFYHDQVMGYLQDGSKKITDDRQISLYAKRSKEILEKAIELKEGFFIGEENLFLEQQFVKLADIYLAHGMQEKQIEVLDKLAMHYEKFADYNWGYKKNALYSLALAYKDTGENNRAIDLFDMVKKDVNFISPIIVSSILEAARLKFSKIEKKEITNPDVIAILSDLKDLTIQRKIQNEPSHLEAALEYVDIQVTLEAKASSVEKKLSLLSMMKDKFLSDVDIISKDYHALKNKLPAKEKIFTSYMKCIDAEILLCQAKLAKDEESQNLKKQACIIFQNIIEDNATCTSYLKKRAYDNLKSL